MKIYTKISEDGLHTHSHMLWDCCDSVHTVLPAGCCPAKQPACRELMISWHKENMEMQGQLAGRSSICFGAASAYPSFAKSGHITNQLGTSGCSVGGLGNLKRRIQPF